MEERIIGIGHDIENIARFASIEFDTYSRYLSALELLEVDQISEDERTLSLAKVWVAKEAVFKALRTENIDYKTITLSKDQYGGPIILIDDEKLKKYICNISISHTNQIVSAFVVISVKF